jgi:hypothetical protein
LSRINPLHSQVTFHSQMTRARTSQIQEDKTEGRCTPRGRRSDQLLSPQMLRPPQSAEGGTGCILHSESRNQRCTFPQMPSLTWSLKIVSYASQSLDIVNIYTRVDKYKFFKKSYFVFRTCSYMDILTNLPEENNPKLMKITK